MNFNSFSEAVNIKTLEDYEVIINSRYPNGIIGKGAFSIVKLVKDKASGQHFAMKMVSYIYILLYIGYLLYYIDSKI